MNDPDPLDALRDSVRETTEAAERLLREVPPQGWATAVPDTAVAEEAQALITLLHALRDVVPPEVWDQVRELLHRLVLLVRALLDVVAERLEHRADAPGGGGRSEPAVQDIPIG